MTTTTKAPAVKAAKKTSPGTKRLKATLGTKGTAALSAAVVADQTAAREAVKAEPAKAAKTAKAKPEKSVDNRKITILAKSCPSKPGTKRAERWAKLKSGMSVEEAREQGIPRVYLERMSRGGHIKLG